MSKFLKEVVVILVGKQAEPITDLLDNKKYVNEFLIAKKLGLTINQTRNILYKIADHGLVSSIRKKDKRKGWYTYFWKIENLKSLEFLKDILTKKIENVNNQIKSRETKVFYICKNCNIEYNEENALLHDFTCPECGEVFVKSDNAKVLKELTKESEKLKREFAIIAEEIGKEKEVSEKKRVKEKNKFEKDKKDRRKRAKKIEVKPVKKEKKAKHKSVQNKKKQKSKKVHSGVGKLNKKSRKKGKKR
jgi:transcription initiation factor TFIIE subunit alpha